METEKTAVVEIEAPGTLLDGGFVEAVRAAGAAPPNPEGLEERLRRIRDMERQVDHEAGRIRITSRLRDSGSSVQ